MRVVKASYSMEMIFILQLLSVWCKCAGVLLAGKVRGRGCAPDHLGGSAFKRTGESGQLPYAFG